jgi:hypothetical protein
VSVDIRIPTSIGGVSLAQIGLNGTFYHNGSVLSRLISGYNYTFTVGDVASGYGFSQWAVSEGGITGIITSISTTIYFQCTRTPGCAPVNLSVSLAANNHSLMSGEAFEATVADSMTATFTVPTLSWHYPNNTSRVNPPAGAYEIADWGVGLGGVLNSPALVTGLQFNFSANGTIGEYNLTYTPFYSTTIKNRANQFNFSWSSGQTVSPGDVIGVGIEPAAVHCVGGVPVWWNCNSGSTIEIADLTAHNGQYWSFGASPSLPSAATGQWMTWDPVNSSGQLSPNYMGGVFSNLSFNNLGIYPSGQGTHPCSPWPACVPSDPGSVDFSQWANAGAGWNESLNPGTLLYTFPTVSFEPSASYDASVELTIFPYDSVQTSDTLQVIAAGRTYSNGESTNLPAGALTPINATPLPAIGSGGSLYFGEWGTTAGRVTNPASQVTTISVSQPGRLEPLTRGLAQSWGGYVDATSYQATRSVTGTFRVPMTLFNDTAYNDSAHNLTGPGAGRPWEVLDFWVGLGGYLNVKIGGTTKGPYFWQAGISINYSSNASHLHGLPPTLAISPWYEYINASCLNTTGCPVVNGPSSYLLSVGDLINATVSACGPPACSSWTDSWSIVDYSQPPYPNQPRGSGGFENWSGTLVGSPPVDTNTSEWIVEAPVGPACDQTSNGHLVTQVCIMPTLSDANYSFSFSGMWINGKPVDLLGPFQVVDSLDIHPGAPTYVQRLIPALVVGASISSFWVRED